MFVYWSDIRLSDKLNEGTNNFPEKGNDLGMKVNGGKSLSKQP